MTFRVFSQYNRFVAGVKKSTRACSVLGVMVTTTCLMAQPRMQPPPADPVGPNNPLLARYDGAEVTLHSLETYAREMPLPQRIPFARSTGEWRRFMAGELAKMTALTSQAINMGFQMDPGYLRARDYFINEYLDYLVLRDQVTNKIDLSAEALDREYETHKSDFWSSETATFRMIRTRDAQKIAEAAKKINEGEDFRQVEMEYSQVSPRFRGTLLGPFPTRERQAVIPPPQQVVDAALNLKEGQTTGPFELNGFHYLLKTEKKTEGRQRTRTEVATELAERLRDRQSAEIAPAMVEQIQIDLNVQVDEELFASANTHPGDVLATVGTFLLTRKEFDDLNGSVRGPAMQLASGMPTKLKQFVTPYMLAEWAKSRGYMDRPETRKALYFYDLQHLAAKVDMDIGMQLLPFPSDEELRARFERDKHELRRPGAPEPRFEDHKQDMINSLLESRAPEVEKRVREFVLKQINFQTVPPGTVQNISAFEALIKARDQLTSGAKLVEISPMQLPLIGEVTPYHDIGRAPKWRIVTETSDGKRHTTEVAGPAPLLEGEQQFADIPAMQPWVKLWRFDTDSLKRHAVDEALGDFIAKHNDRVQVAARVSFSYSSDAPTSPTGSMITYTVVPSDGAVSDGLEFAYTGDQGDVAQVNFGARQGRCLTCEGGVETAPAVASAPPAPAAAEGTTSPAVRRTTNEQSKSLPGGKQ